MSSIYQNEIDIFRRAFAPSRHQKIVIYGIGQRTSMLLPGITDFQVIGLLDRDPSNVGQELSGIPVISLETAARKADLIIICADPSNYETIYRRIRQVHVPVYFANGEKAHLTTVDTDFQKDSYWNRNAGELRNAIDRHEVITFDIFDTLVTRCVLLPQDVFRLVDRRMFGTHGNPGTFDFYRERIRAAGKQDGLYFSLEEIYDKIQEDLGLSDETRAQLMAAELQVEAEAIVPRKAIVDALRYAIRQGKEVWLISDMYLTKSMITALLAKAGIDDVPPERILISCEEQADKKSGALFKRFLEKYIPSRSASAVLHVGDNPVGDDAMPRKYGCDTYPIRNARDQLDHSAMRGATDAAVGLQESTMAGLVMSHLLNDPFGLHSGKGQPYITTCRDFGYLVFGPLMTKFLGWLLTRARANGTKRLLFCARDGWFLSRDLAYLLEHLGVNAGANAPEIKYLPASRRLIFATNVNSDADLLEFAQIPYRGTFQSYMHSRFNVTVDARTEGRNERDFDSSGLSDEELVAALAPYQTEIREELRRERENYDQYLMQEGFIETVVPDAKECSSAERNHLDPIEAREHLTWNTNDALVDLGFNGTNQYKYQAHTGRRMKGYYFLYNYEPANRYAAFCDAEACFNDPRQSNGRDSLVGRRSMFLESFLTAPYGMIRYIDETGRFVTEPGKKNQENFALKEEINAGIQTFMRDYIELLHADAFPDNLTAGTSNPNSPSGTFPEIIYSEFFSGKCKVAPEVLEAFYFDNDIVGTGEIRCEVPTI